MIAGILGVVGAAIHPPTDDLAGIADALWIPSHVLLWAAFALGLFGWVGVRERQSGKAGMFGTAGFVLLFLGAVGVSGILFDAFATVPFIAAEAPSLIQTLPSSSAYLAGAPALLAFIIGGIVFGVAIARSQVFSRTAGLLIVGGSVFLLVAAVTRLPEKVFDAGIIIFSLGQVWLGRSVWTSARLTNRVTS